MIPCACGCGELIEEFDNRGRPRKFKNYHGNKDTQLKSGDKHPSWNGGKRLDSKGYVLIWTPYHPRKRTCGKYVFEHILVVEKHLGRYLTDDEIIHHVNGNRQDNRIDNLEIVTRAEHNKIHFSR